MRRAVATCALAAAALAAAAPASLVVLKGVATGQLAAEAAPAATPVAPAEGAAGDGALEVAEPVAGLWATGDAPAAGAWVTPKADPELVYVRSCETALAASAMASGFEGFELDERGRLARAAARLSYDGTWDAAGEPEGATRPRTPFGQGWSVLLTDYAYVEGLRPYLFSAREWAREGGEVWLALEASYEGDADAVPSTVRLSAASVADNARALSFDIEVKNMDPMRRVDCERNAWVQ